jgi:hypothetical protein
VIRCLICTLLFVSISVNAATSLRVGNRVLTIGDSVIKVRQLMGEPEARVFIDPQSTGLPRDQVAPAEQWQYAQDGKTIVITIVNGRTTNFETLYK